MGHMYYCSRCRTTTDTPRCPRCKSDMQRVLRVMEPEELVEQLATIGKGVGGKHKQSRIRMRPQLQVIRGGALR